LRLEDVERRLTVLEEKLQAALLASTPEKDLLTIRTDADRQIAAYRGKMNAAQVDQLHKQYLHKRLLERYSLPRLSLFYM
jgi:carbamate kinase